MSTKSAVYFPFTFVVWFIAVLYISAGLSLSKLLIMVVLAIVSALLTDKIIGKNLKTHTDNHE